MSTDSDVLAARCRAVARLLTDADVVVTGPTLWIGETQVLDGGRWLLA